MKNPNMTENALSKLILIEKYRLRSQASSSLKMILLKNRQLEASSLLRKKISLERDLDFFSGKKMLNYDAFLDKLTLERREIFQSIEIEEKKLYEIHKKLETVITKTKIVERIKTKQHRKWQKEVSKTEVIRNDSYLDL